MDFYHDLKIHSSVFSENIKKKWSLSKPKLDFSCVMTPFNFTNVAKVRQHLEAFIEDTDTGTEFA